MQLERRERNEITRRGFSWAAVHSYRQALWPYDAERAQGHAATEFATPLDNPQGNRFQSCSGCASPVAGSICCRNIRRSDRIPRNNADLARCWGVWFRMAHAPKAREDAIARYR